MPPSKKALLKEARTSLDLAKAQLDRAQIAWWEPPEPAECVTNSFYAYENAVTAAMVAFGRKRTFKHFEKSQIASELYEENKLKTDVSERLAKLNELRKDVQYGQPGFELESENLEQLVADLELFVDEVDEIIGGLEQ